MSLADCLTQAGKALSSRDRKAIEAAVEGGMSEQDAVLSVIDGVDAELSDIVSRLEGQGVDVARVDESGEPLVVYHGGEAQVLSPNVTEDQDGLLPGFSVSPDRGVAEGYGSMRSEGGGIVTEYEIDQTTYRPVGEMEAYDLIAQEEEARGLDEGDLSQEDARQMLLDRGFNAIEYPDAEFGIRVLDPSILKPAAQEAADQRDLYQGGTINTQSDAFKEWFGDSKVVDESGEPLVVYHATRAEFDAFHPLSHFGDAQAAEDILTADTWEDEETGEMMSEYEDGARVIAAYISIQNPIAVGLEDDGGGAQYTEPADPLYQASKHLPDGGSALVEEALSNNDLDEAVRIFKSFGYDGIEYINRVESPGSTSYIPFDPTQIKSVNNRGTFDATDPRIMYQGSLDTSSEAFKEFFGDSKVVDENGKPLVVYHGGAADIEAFDTTRETQRGQGDIAGTFFSADQMTASNYRQRPGGRVYAAYLSLQNPLDITEAITGRAKGVSFGDAKREALKALDRDVHDGVIFRGDDLNQPEYVAFDPAQIKSVNNRGTFDANDPRIMYQSGVPLIEQPIEVKGSGKNGVIKVVDIGNALTDDHMQKYGRKLYPEDSEEDYALVLDQATDEVAAQLLRENSGVGWYSKDVQDAIDMTSEIFPSLTSVPSHRQLYLTFAGIFSNGMDPDQAWVASAGAFDAFIHSGEVPVNRGESMRGMGLDAVQTSYKDRKTGKQVTKDAGWGVRNAANEQQLAFVKYMVEREGGLADAMEWLTSKQKRADINAAMIDSGLYKAGRFKTKKALEGQDEYGFLFLGDKLGRYTMGLHGIEEATADDTTVDLWYTRTFRRWTGRLLDKPLGKEGVVAQPDPKNGGAERKTIFRLTEELAKAFGIDIGDTQAVLWFFEKRLYGALGVRTNEGTNSSGARKVLDEYDRGGSDGSRVRARQEAARELFQGGVNAADLVAGSRRAGEAGVAQDTGEAAAEADYATPGDLAALKERLDPGIFQKRGWGVISATQDWGDNKFGPQHNARALAGLKGDLDRLGLPYIEQQGVYEGKDDGISLMVLADEQTLTKLAKLYKQDSILTSDGLIYTKRVQPNTPFTGDVMRGDEAISQDYYSTVGGRPYSLGMDFSTGAGAAVFREGYTEAEGRPQLPVNADGKVELHHWGPSGLSSIDPSFAGTNPRMAGAERNSALKKSFFGVNPRRSQMDPGTGYVREGATGPVQYVTEIDPDQIYPFYSDPENLTKGKTLEEAEQAIKDAGYIGYYTEDDGSMRAPLGNVAALFEALPAKPATRDYFQSAWHGTPHLFDKFSLSAIGTGEGAQAYGWGLYFAGKKAIAEYYRDALSRGRGVGLSRIEYTAPNGRRAIGNDASWIADDLVAKYEGSDAPGTYVDEWSGKTSPRPDSPMFPVAWAVQKIQEPGSSPSTEDLIREMREEYVHFTPEALDYAEQAVRAADLKLLDKPEGNLYQVDIPEDSELLDYDKPLSEQGEIGKKVAALLQPTTEERASDKALLDELGVEPVAGPDPILEMTGAQAYDAIAVREAKRFSLKGMLQSDRARFKDGEKAASHALNEAGIPGLRYLDNTSRRDGDGTYNYVIWDESRVTVEAVNDQVVQAREMFQGQDGARGKIKLPASGVKGAESVIKIFENADESTILHESAHFFFEVFADLASQPNAPEQMKSDLKALQEYTGWNGKGNIPVDAHETFARSWERYFMEGKAPTVELQGVFSTFKKWLTDIYLTVKRLNVPLTDDVREIFDRMLATDAEIEAARADAGMTPLFDIAPAGMTASEFKAYQDLVMRAQSAAEDAVRAKATARVRRAKTEEWAAERALLRSQVEEEVNGRPVYALIEALGNQKWINGDDAEVPDMRIDRDQMVAVAGEYIVDAVDRSKIGGRRGILKKGGEDPAVVAEFFGFDSAAEMGAALRDAGKRKQVIEDEIDRIMEERHGDPLENIEQAAMEAVHNDPQAMVAVAEARALAKELGRDAGMTMKVYRARARQMIAVMPIGMAAKPAQFLAAERRAAKKAQEALSAIARGKVAPSRPKKGGGMTRETGGEASLAEAFQAKEQQILNHMLYNEAVKIEKEMERGRKKARSFLKPKVREKIDETQLFQIDALLERFDFRQRSKKQIERAESLAQYVQRMTDEGREDELAIDDALLNEANSQHYSKLTVEEFTDLMDAINNLEHVGRLKNELIEKGRRRKLAKSVENVVGQVLDNLKKRNQKVRSVALQAANLGSKPDTIMIRLDNGEEIGVAYDELKRAIDAGTALEQKMNVELAEKIDALFEQHFPEKADLKRMAEETVVDGQTWTREMIISLAQNVGNPSNFQRVMDPNVNAAVVMTKDRLDTLLSTLSEADWRFVQDYWTLINSYWPEFSATQKRRTGVTPRKVEAQVMWAGAPSFVTGGYYPIKYDPTLSERADMDEKTAWDKAQSAGRGAVAAVRDGMKYKRQATGGGRALEYSLGVGMTHMRDVIRVIALSEAIDNTGRILRHRDVRDAFINTGNKDTLDTLMAWLQDQATGRRARQDLANRIARAGKNNFTMSRLFWNFKTVILQVTGLGQSAAAIGKKNMIKGFVAYGAKRGEAIELATRLSPEMAERQRTFQKDIYDFMGDLEMRGPLATGYQKGKEFAGQVGFAPITAMQFYFVDMPTWVGAFNAKINEGMTEEEAAHYATRMVERAQDSGSWQNRSGLERGTVSTDGAQFDTIRFFMTLGGYMLTKANRLYVRGLQGRRDFRQADTALGKVEAVADAAVDFGLLLMFEAAFMAIIYSAIDDEDEPEDIAAFILKETGMAMIGGIPIVRDIASSMSGYGGGGIYGGITDGYANIAKQAMQFELDASLAKALSTGLGTATGFPSTLTNRIIDFSTGEATPAELLMGRSPLTR